MRRSNLVALAALSLGSACLDGPIFDSSPPPGGCTSSCGYSYAVINPFTNALLVGDTARVWFYENYSMSTPASADWTTLNSGMIAFSTDTGNASRVLGATSVLLKAVRPGYTNISAKGLNGAQLYLRAVDSSSIRQISASGLPATIRVTDSVEFTVSLRDSLHADVAWTPTSVVSDTTIAVARPPRMPSLYRPRPGIRLYARAIGEFEVTIRFRHMTSITRIRVLP